MNIKNKFLLGICLIFLIGIISGCGFSVQDKNWNNKQESTDNKQENMYNDNEKIVQEESNYTYLTYGYNRNANEFDIKYTGFSGIDTILFLEVKEDTEITFSYDSTVDKGKFKAVLINPKNELENILEGTDQGSKAIKLTKGKYIFRTVGAKADGKIKIAISNNPDVKITDDKK